MVRKVLKIEKESDGHTMSLRLSGRIQSADIGNITAQMGDDSVRMLLDLSEVTLVDVEAVRFLSNCEHEGIVLVHCPLYVREWILRERAEGAQTDEDDIPTRETAESTSSALLSIVESRRHQSLKGTGVNDGFAGIVGSETLREVLKLVQIVAPTNSTTLIQGETGTGKQLIAQAVHNLSSRRGRPFVKLNCAAIPLDLLESELFGHEKGAFTGAIARRAGRFEVAHQGTLFLDEIGDIPLALQPKLLRVLQEQEFERLGSGQTHKVDVRIIAATHRNLAEMAARNEFRSDLYYRLNVFPISVPPLRERREDIRQLVLHFVAVFARRMGKHIEQVPEPTINAFIAYHWPGNVRELQNLVERAVIGSDNGVLPNPLSTSQANTTSPVASRGTLRDREAAIILETLRATGGMIGGPQGAAVRLGLKRTTLVYKMKRLGIFRPRQRLMGEWDEGSKLMI
jgi:transcriptional regulator with GAF, ATPase, and Fis domain